MKGNITDRDNKLEHVTITFLPCHSCYIIIIAKTIQLVFFLNETT